MLLEGVYGITSQYIENVPKSKRKAIGQFFTPPSIAEFMGSLVDCTKRDINILDAGAGTGLLATAVVEKLVSSSTTNSINIDFYESNKDILSELQKSINLIQTFTASNNVTLTTRVVNENYILNNKEFWNSRNEDGLYDIIISNPPYKKIAKNDEEAQVMSDVVYGQPNLYGLFMAMAAKMLKPQGQFIFIVPRSWTSGLYFSAIRRFLFNRLSISHLHLFASRDKLFDDEVLQETMIIKAIRSTSKQASIAVTSCTGSTDFNSLISFSVPYDTCVESHDHHFMYLPTSQRDVDTLTAVNSFTNTLEDIGLKLKTGLTVDFRSKKWMRNVESHDTVPLFWACHFDNGRIVFPVPQAENQYLTTGNPALLMPNANYLFMKRFSSKEETRRLQPSIYLKTRFPYYSYISTENHLNFIACLKGEMEEDDVWGLYVIFSSTLYDKYYRILNGNTQVNATEINSIPIPSLDSIRELGHKAKHFSPLSTQICDGLLEDLLHEKRRSKGNFDATRDAIEAAG